MEILPKGESDKRMTEFASGIKDFGKYLGDGPDSWAEKLRSEHDSEKRFNGEDQPVVGVSWFEARAYCFWLSLLDEASQGLAPNEPGHKYRLPTELECEWAAGGGERKYPWTSEKGPPTDKLVNYGHNVGSTNSVWRYPNGATPEGLMDMAGNVWEWMENWYGEGMTARSLRGGSWYSFEDRLRCSYRADVRPDARNSGIGFRVVLSQP